MNKLSKLFIFTFVFLANIIFAKDIYNFQSNDQELTILEHSISALYKRIILIRNAKSSIDLEYFIFNRDLSGKIILKELVKKAEEGVKVRILVDHFMTKKEFSKKFIYVLNKHNISVKVYNPAPITKFNKVQYRNHRKLFIIDREHLITGGRNIGDDYFDLSTHYNFYDREIYLQGNIVSSISDSFDDFWNSKNSKFSNLKGPREKVYTKSYKRGKSYQRELRLWDKKLLKYYNFLNKDNDKYLTTLHQVMVNGPRELKHEVTGTCHDILFVSDRPYVTKKERKKFKRLKDFILQKLKSTKNRLIIDSPYFIINKHVKKILKDIRVKKDLKFDIYTNGLYSTDAFYANSVLNTVIKKYLSNNVFKFHFFDGFNVKDYNYLDNSYKKTRKGTHSKTYIFDNKFFIGTYNFDPRSNIYNSELGIQCNNSTMLTQTLISSIKKRYLTAHIVEKKKDLKKVKFKNVSFFKVLTYYLGNLPSLLFIHLL